MLINEFERWKLPLNISNYLRKYRFKRQYVIILSQNASCCNHINIRASLSLVLYTGEIGKEVAHGIGALLSSAPSQPLHT